MISEKRPVLSAAMVRHAGAVNRVRAWNAGDRVLCANWSERAEVHIWDLAEQLKATHDKHAMSNFIRYAREKSKLTIPSATTRKRSNRCSHSQATGPRVTRLIGRLLNLVGLRQTFVFLDFNRS